jgi:hypothetical protein
MGLAPGLGLAFDHGVHGRSFRYWDGNSLGIQRPGITTPL